MNKNIIYENKLNLIGNTPMVKLNKICNGEIADILLKLEFFNPGGSIKDRIALSMIEDAESRGLLKEDSTIIEPTSGNTGIGIAMISAIKGYKCILTMPDSMSLERIYILKSYGAKVVLTPAYYGMQGAIDKAEEIHRENKESIILRQFDNPANPRAHRETTAKEILEATNGDIDIFVSSVGTGGTITGVGEVLKKNIPNIRIVAVEPISSSVLSGGQPGPHKIPGIGAGFIPKILNKDIIDEIIRVGDNEAYSISKRLSVEEGLFVGISTGANVFAALKVAKNIGKNKKIVTIAPDSGERYFSITQYYTV